MTSQDKASHLGELTSRVKQTLAQTVSPLAAKYGYLRGKKLNAQVGWKPIVLVLGNYSSGKSTFINELIGSKIQETGQAPTDDCFTVITGHDLEGGAGEGKVHEREGNVLLYDDQLPFTPLQRHGDRFASHFRLKQVAEPWLRSLAIIDSPGMHDSVAEKDRGYDYQEVIGDLARIADLIVVFDPHKAGTISESYASLRETLPKNTPDDRLLFVMNRIDECMKLEDLLRVYGTLCWNLSQMMGRKDIPRILLTYSASVSTYDRSEDSERSYLRYLENQRQKIYDVVCEAPYRKLDHMVGFVRTHAQRLEHLLRVLSQYEKKRGTSVCEV